MAAASDSSPQGSLTMRSSDGEEFTVPKKEAFLNENIKELFDPENEGEVVPLEIKSDTLKLMNEFNKMTIEQGTSTVKRVQEFDEELEDSRSDFSHQSNKDVSWFERLEDWYRTFFDNLETPTLGNLLMAADYIRNEELRHGVCLKIASLHNGLPAEKTRELFFGENGLGANLEEGLASSSSAAS
eukprot:gb/GECG01008814.1/.p1 GENE.gb/GECG01008814.1/~~gb/GECG01008814.1/.p1  ORF type:complete len:185 (+),score=34.90 gb/GECG01008814.1/:1-555(+)